MTYSLSCDMGISRPQILVRLQLYFSVLALLHNLESRYNCLFVCVTNVTKWHTIPDVLIWDLLVVLEGHRDRSAHSRGMTPSIQTSNCCLSTHMCPDFWPLGHNTVPNQCNGFISPICKRKTFITKWIVE